MGKFLKLPKFEEDFKKHPGEYMLGELPRIEVSEEMIEKMRKANEEFRKEVEESTKIFLHQ